MANDYGSHEARELRLFIENDEPLYRQMFKPILQNQCKKKKKGVWNAKLAAKGWMHLVEAGAKKYAREHATPSEWNKIFTMATRRHVAKLYAEETADQCREYGLGALGRAAKKLKRRR
jgi:hypothetical protein